MPGVDNAEEKGASALRGDKRAAPILPAPPLPPIHKMRAKNRHPGLKAESENGQLNCPMNRPLVSFQEIVSAGFG